MVNVCQMEWVDLVACVQMILLDLVVNKDYHVPVIHAKMVVFVFQLVSVIDAIAHPESVE